MEKPLILLDSPDDGYCESFGWVDDVISENEARDLLAPWCCDPETGDVPYRPTGHAKIVFLVPDRASKFEDEWRWHETHHSIPDSFAFWQIDVTE